MLKFLLVFGFWLFWANCNAGSQRTPDSNQSIYNFIEKEVGAKVNPASLSVEYVVENTDTLIAIHYNSNIFVATVYNQWHEVLGFSFENGINEANIDEQKRFLKSLYRRIDKTTQPVTLKMGILEETIGPLVPGMFGQTKCHNEWGSIINVTNLYTPKHVAVGCVAISLVTALHYYQWPKHGEGEKTYTDNLGSLRGEHSANFEDESYYWVNVPNEYDKKSTTTTEREELGVLAYQAAVALEMDFESGGSTSNINRIPDAFYKHFKHYGEYQSNTSATFFDRVDSTIAKESPVILAISGNGYGHSIICDGWKITDSGRKYNHLNMGWWGASNGWYKIRDNFDVGGYTSIDGAVFDIVPVPDITVAKQNNDFIIEWDSPENIQYKGYELQAKIGRKSWETIAEIENDSTFVFSNDMESNYAFRIRMKYDNFQEIAAWSNLVIVTNDPTGIEEDLLSGLKIYPNPVTDILHVDCKTCTGNTAIEIMDITGKIVRSVDLYDRKSDINVSDLEQGGYIIRISNSEKMYRQIFIKK